MANAAINDYTPDYAVSPGEVLRYELELRDMSQAELAERAGLCKQRVMAILNGDDRVIITPETALKLEHALGMPVEYWLNLEAHYRETRARLAKEAGPEHSRLAKMPARQRLKVEKSHKKSAVK